MKAPKLGELISPEYQQLNRDLHAQPRKYGQSGRKHAAEIMAIADITGYKDVLDYGCGQGTLREAIVQQGWDGFVREYDPAVPGKEVLPGPAQIVVCTDVLEHIEPDRIVAVLGHLALLTWRLAYFSISLKPSNKSLRDGRNAHLIVQPSDWWIERILERGFSIASRFVRLTEEGEADLSLWLRRS